MTKLLFLLMSLSLQISLSAQDRDMENEYYHRRNDIRQKGIKEISEYKFQEWKKDCSKEEAKIIAKYYFDRNGNLIQVDNYNYEEQLSKTIEYKRRENGDYYDKKYIVFDTIGIIEFVAEWEFEFDEKGRRIIEVCKRDTVIWFTNVLTYDKSGNMIKQVRDNFYEWHFKYNKKNQLIERQEFINHKDSVAREAMIKYEYTENLLSREIIYHRSADTIIQTNSYTYDNQGNLTQIFDPNIGWIISHSGENWSSIINNFVPTNREYENSKKKMKVESNPKYTIFIYNKNNNCIMKNLSHEGEKPFRCYFFDYKYY